MVTNANLPPARSGPARSLVIGTDRPADIVAFEAEVVDFFMSAADLLGVPKSVAMHHRSVIDFMDWAFDTLALDGSEVIGSLSPFHFDIYTVELWLCLARGATLVVIPEPLSAFPCARLKPTSAVPLQRSPKPGFRSLSSSAR